jgi:hypothetical protein
MKSFSVILALGCALALSAGTSLAADKTEKNDKAGQAVLKLTCCQQAAARGKECRKKCCVAAHHDGKSCEICNPNHEDLKLKRTVVSPKAAQE